LGNIFAHVATGGGRIGLSVATGIEEEGVEQSTEGDATVEEGPDVRPLHQLFRYAARTSFSV